MNALLAHQEDDFISVQVGTTLLWSTNRGRDRIETGAITNGLDGSWCFYSKGATVRGDNGDASSRTLPLRILWAFSACSLAPAWAAVGRHECCTFPVKIAIGWPVCDIRISRVCRVRSSDV